MAQDKIAGSTGKQGTRGRALEMVRAMKLTTISALLPLILSGDDEHLHLYSKLEINLM